MNIDFSDVKKQQQKTKHVSFYALLPGLNSEQHILEIHTYHLVSSPKMMTRNNSSGSNSIKNAKGEHLFCEPWDVLNCFSHKCRKVSAEAPAFQIAWCLLTSMAGAKQCELRPAHSGNLNSSSINLIT